MPAKGLASDDLRNPMCIFWYKAYNLGYIVVGRRLHIKPKRRSWILVFSRKERKDRKAYRDGGVLQDFQSHPLFWVFTIRVNCRTERAACIITKNTHSLRQKTRRVVLNCDF